MEIKQYSGFRLMVKLFFIDEKRAWIPKMFPTLIHLLLAGWFSHKMPTSDSIRLLNIKFYIFSHRTTIHDGYPLYQKRGGERNTCNIGFVTLLYMHTTSEPAVLYFGA